ncbi:MAG TPA: hypothetical protein VHJ17_13045 [Thermomonospora sp.]|nr:hypothetical protein [Thermomonospora sp.]
MTVRVLGLKSGMTTEDHRQGLSLFTPPIGGVLERRSGVVHHPAACHLEVTGLPPMQARLSPFAALIDGTSAPLQGAYPLVSDSDVIITFEPGEASVDRIDQVIARIRDDPYDASGERSGTVECLKGLPTGEPAPLPPSSLALWEVTVPAGAPGGGTAGFGPIRRVHSYVTGLGGPIPVSGQAERDALPAYDLLTVLRLDTGDVEQYRHYSWRPMNWRYDTGWVQITTLEAGWQSVRTPKVRRIGDFVELRGIVKRVSGGTATILRLPPEFRSARYIIWPVSYWSEFKQAHLMTRPAGEVGVDVGLESIAPQADLFINNRWLAG